MLSCFITSSPGHYDFCLLCKILCYQALRSEQTTYQKGLACGKTARKAQNVTALSDKLLCVATIERVI